MPKANGRANVCAHRKSTKPCNSKKNVLAAFYRKWYVVVHPCSSYSLRRQMSPLQSIKFQTADFAIFCARIIVIFWATCIGREVFSVVLTGNVTHILSVLHWLEVVITGSAGSAAGSSAGIVFTHDPILGFFAPQGRHIAPNPHRSMWKLAGRSGPQVRSSLPNFTLIGSGMGVYGPQNWKNWNFTNIITHRGRVLCTIFTKFTGYMRVRSLYNTT